MFEAAMMMVDQNAKSSSGVDRELCSVSGVLSARSRDQQAEGGQTEDQKGQVKDAPALSPVVRGRHRAHGYHTVWSGERLLGGKCGHLSLDSLRLATDGQAPLSAAGATQQLDGDKGRSEAAQQLPSAWRRRRRCACQLRDRQ